MADKRNNSAQNYLFYGIFLCVLAFSPVFYDIYQLPKALLLAAGCALYISIFSFINKKTYFGAAAAAAALFLIYISARALFSLDNFPPAYYLLTLMAPAAFFMPSVTKIKPAYFLVFINIISLLSSLYAVFEYVNTGVRPVSFFGNPVFLAEFTACLFPFILVSLLAYEKYKPFTAVNLCLSLLVLALASSRGAVLSLGISLLIFLFLLFTDKPFPASGKKKTAIIMLIVLTLFGAITFLPRFKPAVAYNINRALEIAGGGGASLLNRGVIFETGIKMAAEKPVFGFGAGGFRYYFQKYQHSVVNPENPVFINTSYAHNDYLQLLVETGAAGLILFILFAAFLLISFDKTKSEILRQDKPLAYGLLASVIFFLCESLYNFPLFIMPLAFMFWFFCGALYYMPDAKNNKLNIPSPLLAFLMVPVFIFLFISALPTAANLNIKKGFIALQKKTNMEMKYFDRAVFLEPYNFYTRYYRGYSLLNNDRKKAYAEYEEALKIYPYSADMLYNLGAMHLSDSEYEQAETYLKKALELNPYFGMAHASMAMLYLKTKRENLVSAELYLASKYDPRAVDSTTDQRVILFKETTALK